MQGYPVEAKEREARAAGTYMPVSAKSSSLVCRKVNGLPLEQAKRYLNALVEERTDINGKHYTTAARHILTVIESAEKNAGFKGLGKLKIRTITAEQGPTRMRRKRKGGRLLKLTHVKVVLEETEKPKETPKKEKKPADAQSAPAKDKKTEEKGEKK